MMDSVDSQVADIERELLALTANQPPNPNQMPLYTQVGVTSSDPQVFDIVFDDGIIRLMKAFTTPGNYATLSYYLGGMQIYVAGTPPVTFTVVSLGKFSIV